MFLRLNLWPCLLDGLLGSEGIEHQRTKLKVAGSSRTKLTVAGSSPTEVHSYPENAALFKQIRLYGLVALDLNNHYVREFAVTV